MPTSPVMADIYVYRTPEGRKLYTDRTVNLPGYLPLNVLAKNAFRSGTYPKEKIDRIIDKWAPHYTLDPQLVKTVVLIESGYRIRALSPANAQGLMQLMPDTATRFGVSDPWDPEQNIRGGMAYLQWLMSEFRGKVTKVLAAYNAGENNVVKYGGVPPFPETKRYLEKIRRYYHRQEHPYAIVSGSSSTPPPRLSLNEIR